MTGQRTTSDALTSDTDRDSGDSTSTCFLRFSKWTRWRMSAARAFFKRYTNKRKLVNSSVHWPLHVYKRPFAQNAVEHGAPCVSPCSHQESILVGLLALSFASGRFFVVFGTALRTLALALAFASLFSFALALVLLGRRVLSFPLASARGKAVF